MGDTSSIAPLFMGAFYRKEVKGMSEKVLDELAEWIDPRVIAEAILQELKSQEVEQTVPNGMRVWLDVLESQLPDAIRSSIKAIF